MERVGIPVSRMWHTGSQRGDMGRYRGNVEIFQQEITSLAETALERVLERV